MKPILALVILISFLSIISCTKTNNVSTTVHDTTRVFIKDTTVLKDTVWQKALKNPITGLWVGTFKVNGDVVDSFYYSFAIDSNGVMYTTDINANATASSTGPWHLNGTTFTATLFPMDGGSPVFSQGVTAAYDSVAGTLKGTNNYITGSGLNTNFFLIRVP